MGIFIALQKSKRTLSTLKRICHILQNFMSQMKKNKQILIALGFFPRFKKTACVYTDHRAIMQNIIQATIYCYRIVSDAIYFIENPHQN